VSKKQEIFLDIKLFLIMKQFFDTFSALRVSDYHKQQNEKY